MATSQYFNNFSVGVINEQRLLEDLINESVRIMGHDVHYIPRDAYDGDDQIFGETRNAKFTRAYTLECYIANVEGYEGDGDFFSKFGLDIRDTSNFVITARAFNRYIPSGMRTRPREGDLIYVPVMQKLFEIKFVEEELLFFSLGKRNPYIYELRCELMRYNNEDLETGIEEVDSIEALNSYGITLNVSGGSGNYWNGETVYQGANLMYATASATVRGFANNQLELYDIVGSFTPSVQVKGVDSNTIYTVTATDTLDDHTFYDMSDNRTLQNEANTFVDLSETNPFGMP